MKSVDLVCNDLYGFGNVCIYYTYTIIFFIVLNLLILLFLLTLLICKLPYFKIRRNFSAKSRKFDPAKKFQKQSFAKVCSREKC